MEFNILAAGLGLRFRVQVFNLWQGLGPKTEELATINVRRSIFFL